MTGDHIDMENDIDPEDYEGEGDEDIFEVW